ncbi:MAG TPA: ATP-binding protein [Balneolaceae bacterium]|nr:ATP-binding protein [Balneolaceae bacterium]
MKNFRLQIIFRVLVLAVTLAVCIYLWFETTLYLSAALISLLAVYEVSRLIHYAEQTNRKLNRFLESIRYSDFSQSFSGPRRGETFEELDESFARVAEAFKKQRIAKQVQFRYMKTVVRHIGIGLISFDRNGNIELMNKAAKKLFDVASLRTIDDIEKISPRLLDAIKNIEGNDRDVVQLSINNKSMQLAVRATVFRLRDSTYKLVSLQDINAELEEKEMEAWQNLTQVLAHEIMNSVTPIASLSETVQMLLKTHIRENEDGYIINKEAVTDVSDALDTIENRSEGLIRFVNSYRDFTKIPEPELETFSVKKLLQRVQNLNKGEAQDQQIAVNFSVEPDDLKLTADPHLIEQVLINLTKNAFRALGDQPEGTLHLHSELTSKGSVCIQVTDNGPGIPPENLDKIFIPFYSTQRPYKQGGSGIGLSLSRQIMRAHGGTLKVQSMPGEGTTFRLQF